MKLLLDTNVLIDYLGRRAPFFRDAERIMAAGYFGDAQLWASVQSFKDAHYVLSHYSDSAQVQDALARVTDLIHPVDMNGSDLTSGLRLGWGDLEDCLIALCAQKVGADYLVTRGGRGFDRSMVPSITPATWLEQMRKEKGISFEALSLSSS